MLENDFALFIPFRRINYRCPRTGVFCPFQPRFRWECSDVIPHAISPANDGNDCSPDRKETSVTGEQPKKGNKNRKKERVAAEREANERERNETNCYPPNYVVQNNFLEVVKRMILFRHFIQTATSSRASEHKGHFGRSAWARERRAGRERAEACITMEQTKLLYVLFSIHH